MKYAIISDIHSNLEALSIFLELLKKIKVEKIVCLGDLVGYNTNPNECIQIISSIENKILIRGNHDRAASEERYSDFSDHAKIAVKWTINTLSSESLRFLKSLDKGPKIINNKFAIAHGSLIDEDTYILGRQYAREDFYWLKEHNIKISFFGHTHYQIAYSYNEKDEIETIKDNEFFLENDKYYLINPGSIGQPRDGNPNASFAVYDDEEQKIKIIRYSYPLNKTQAKIIKEKLPEFLAIRLAVGK